MSYLEQRILGIDGKINKVEIARIYEKYQPLFFKKRLRTSTVYYVKQSQLRELYENLLSGEHDAYELIISTKNKVGFYLDFDYVAKGDYITEGDYTVNEEKLESSNLVDEMIKDIELFLKVWVASNDEILPYPSHFPPKIYENKWEVPETVPRVYIARNKRLKKDGSYKISAHLHISPLVFDSNVEIRQFIIERIIPFAKSRNSSWYKYIDLSIYRRFSSLRMPFSSKENDIDATLIPDDDSFDYFLGMIITQFNFEYDLSTISEIREELETLKKKSNKRVIEQSSELAELLMEKIRSELNDDGMYDVRDVIDDLIILDRYTESNCIFCNRIHENDNSLFVRYELTYDDDIELRFYCRRQKETSIFGTYTPKKIIINKSDDSELWKIIYSICSDNESNENDENDESNENNEDDKNDKTDKKKSRRRQRSQLCQQSRQIQRSRQRQWNTAKSEEYKFGMFISSQLKNVI
jgi:hypothetical protein